MSFLSIGIIWINHHAMTARLREADHTILMLNLVLLMTIGILPFATNLLANYLRRPEGHTAAAAVLRRVLPADGDRLLGAQRSHPACARRI